jgi:hypothetical protein
MFPTLSGGEKQRVSSPARWRRRPTSCCSTSRPPRSTPATSWRSHALLREPQRARLGLTHGGLHARPELRGLAVHGAGAAPRGAGGRRRARPREVLTREHDRAAVRRRGGGSFTTTRRAPDGRPRLAHRCPVRCCSPLPADRARIRPALAAAACVLAPLVGSTPHLAAPRVRSLDPVRRQPGRADLLRRPAAAHAGRRRWSARRSPRLASSFRRCCATRWRRRSRSACRPARRSARCWPSPSPSPLALPACRRSRVASFAGAAGAVASSTRWRGARQGLSTEVLLLAGSR